MIEIDDVIELGFEIKTAEKKVEVLKDRLSRILGSRQSGSQGLTGADDSKTDRIINQARSYGKKPFELGEISALLPDIDRKYVTNTILRFAREDRGIKQVDRGLYIFSGD